MCFNQGVLFKVMFDVGVDVIGDLLQLYCVVIDVCVLFYDGGICIWIDCVLFGIVVNCDVQCFYDEGEDFWLKCYVIWGCFVVQ